MLSACCFSLQQDTVEREYVSEKKNSVKEFEVCLNHDFSVVHTAGNNPTKILCMTFWILNMVIEEKYMNNYPIYVRQNS